MAEFEERTEQATPRRRQKAREKGQVARSRELTSMVATGGIILVFYFVGHGFLENMSGLTGKLLQLGYGRDPIAVLRTASSEMFLILIPFLGIALVLSVLTGVLQGGFLIKPLTIELETLNPINGFKKLFSLNGLISFPKSLFKFIVGGVLFYYIIVNAIHVLPSTAAMDLKGAQNISVKLITRAVLYSFITFFVIAVIDYLYERWRFERSIRMSKDEIKQESRESEGDPLIKSRIKSIQKEMARKRMMQEVPKATVVITNPTHLAVALRYKKDEMFAPKIIAKGSELVAAKIRDIAREHDIPVVEDKPIARELYKLKIGAFIPEDLYKAVARILAYIYKLRGVA